MPQKLIKLHKNDIKIKVGHSSSNAVQVTTGLRKGDALFPILFNLALEKVIRNKRMNE